MALNAFPPNAFHLLKPEIIYLYHYMVKTSIINTFIDCLAFVQGIIFAFLIIAGGRSKLASMFFALFLFTYSIELGDAIIAAIGYSSASSKLLHTLPFNFYFLNLPLLYLYVLAITGTFNLKRHFYFLLPGIAEFAIFTALSIMHQHIDTSWFKQFFNYYELCSIVFYIIMAIFIIVRVWTLQRNINNIHSTSVDSNLKWVMVICIFLVVYLLFFLAQVEQKSSFMAIVLNVSNVIFIYFLGVLGLRQKYVGVQQLRDNLPENIEIAEIESIKPLIDGETNVKEFERLEFILSSEQLYLNPELDLFTLSQKTKIAPRKLSELIKHHSQKNFKKYINNWRINYAKDLLSSSNSDLYTIEAIAYESGFQSKSTFYVAFNDEFDQTPSDFRQRQIDINKV